MVQLKVDFYKETGKWYSGCIIEVEEDFPFWDTESVRLAVMDKQTALIPDAIKHLYCVVDEFGMTDGIFCKRLFMIGELK